MVLLLPTLPHPVKIKTIENSTQQTNLGPMGNALLHTDPFDAAELLECWFHFGDRLYMNLSIKNRPRGGAGQRGYTMRFYWKKSDIELALAEAPGMSLTFNNCSTVRNRDWC